MADFNICEDHTASSPTSQEERNFDNALLATQAVDPYDTFDIPPSPVENLENQNDALPKNALTPRSRRKRLLAEITDGPELNTRPNKKLTKDLGTQRTTLHGNAGELSGFQRGAIVALRFMHGDKFEAIGNAVGCTRWTASNTWLKAIKNTPKEGIDENGEPIHRLKDLLTYNGDEDRSGRKVHVADGTDPPQNTPNLRVQNNKE